MDAILTPQNTILDGVPNDHTHTHTHKHTHRIRAILATFLACLILLLSTTAAHADRLYRITPIKKIGDNSPSGISAHPDTYGRIGMNNHGEIVYGDGNSAFFLLTGLVAADKLNPRSAWRAAP